VPWKLSGGLSWKVFEELWKFDGAGAGARDEKEVVEVDEPGDPGIGGSTS
jgi:hypothetical protein